MTEVVIELTGAGDVRRHLRERHAYTRKETDNPLGQLRNEHERLHQNNWTDHAHDRY